MQSYKHPSDGNEMLLNREKTVVVNTNLYRGINFEDDITVNNTTIILGTETKLLGVTIDDKSYFRSHINNLIAKSNCRIYLLRQLNTSGMNTDGLQKFYV